MRPYHALAKSLRDKQTKDCLTDMDHAYVHVQYLLVKTFVSASQGLTNSIIFSGPNAAKLPYKAHIPTCSSCPIRDSEDADKPSPLPPPPIGESLPTAAAQSSDPPESTLGSGERAPAGVTAARSSAPFVPARKRCEVLLGDAAPLGGPDAHAEPSVTSSRSCMQSGVWQPWCLYTTHAVRQASIHMQARHCLQVLPCASSLEYTYIFS